MFVERTKKKRRVFDRDSRRVSEMGGCEDVGEISGNILLPPQLPFLSKKFRF